MASTLPEKFFYKIGEVAGLAGVRTSVLRFWESEFPFLKPAKSNSGQRLYSKNEVELILQVKHLLYNEKFTIEGVRKRLNVKGRPITAEKHSEIVTNPDYCDVLKSVRTELKLLRELL